MKKLQSLRDPLLKAIPELAQNPDRILVFADNGNVRSTLANGLSFEYVYTASLVLVDFAGDLAAVSIPVLDWVRIHQPELMSNLDKANEAIKFEAEIKTNDKVDLGIELALTERVIVKRDGGNLSIDYPAEPTYEKAAASTLVTLIDNATGQTLASWQSRDPEEQYFL